MADINYTYDVYTPDAGAQDLRATTHDDGEAAPSLGGMVRVFGALCSLALVAGIGVWAYQLVMRDVSGVPVVRALEGPMRVQPDDPGGTQADHQGLAVNAVAADGATEPTPDRLMLAPRPVVLAAEDTPIGQAGSQAELTNASISQQEDEAPSAEEISDMSVEALIAQLTGSGQTANLGQNPLDTNVADDTPDTPDPDTTVAQVAETGADVAADADAETEPAPVTGPGLSESLRPVARPARAVTSVGSEGDDSVLSSAITSAVDAVASLDVDPETLPAGTRLAQLGAYDNADIARTEWVRLAVKFEDYLEGKQRVIQKASSGGRTFYRLRAMGFDDLSDARRFCSALMSENADCIPVTVR